MTEGTSPGQASPTANIPPGLLNSPEIRFAVSVLKKVFVFVVIALSAALLHIIVDYLEHRSFPPVITITLTGVEYAILFIDILWFIKGLAQELAEMVSGLLHAAIWMQIIIALVVFVLGVVSSPYVIGWGTKFLANIAHSLPQ
jgi:hypothetical protein